MPSTHRHVWVVAALLSVPVSGLAQEVAMNPPAPRLVFDLRDASIKKILRDTVATQSGEVRLAEARQVGRKPAANIDMSPPDEPPLELKPPRQVVEPLANDLSSAIFEILIEEAVDELLDLPQDAEPHYPQVQVFNEWHPCPSDILKPHTQRQGTCTTVNPGE